MLWRTARSGTFGVGAGSVSGSITFNTIPSGFMVAVSTSTSTSWTQSDGTTGLKLDVSNFSPVGGPWTFNSLHVRSASLSNFTEEIANSFFSGNIFGGDTYGYDSRSMYYYDISGTVLLIPITGTIINLTATSTTTGSSGPTPPSTGQLFPRGILTNR